MKQNEVKKANALNVCENVRELNTKSQTLVSGGAYELAENGVDIVGQWFYTD